MKFVVIGITDCAQPFFTPEVLSIITNGKVFSGGRRHHEIVAPLLPANAEWIDITVPLSSVFEMYEQLGGAGQAATLQPIVVFASGDPLFFGFANTIRRQMPEAEVVVYPTFNSLQLLAHRLVMPYHDMRIVSLTGRPWHELDRALIERAAKIGVLTDREHTPAAIAQRMADYGYTCYDMYVGEHLGHQTKERVSHCSLADAAGCEFEQPNCVILVQKQALSRPFGIPDAAFELLDGREKMITKMPVRLLTLQALELPCRHVLWDIGACTGSVSIEARQLFPHLQVVAFEVRPECEAIINENARRFGTPGISVHIGDFCAVCCDAIAAPDAVFIGGHGGHLKEIMTKALRYLAPGGCMVMNSVKAPKVLTDSHQLWTEACRDLQLVQEPSMRVLIDNHHPIEILKARKT